MFSPNLITLERKFDVNAHTVDLVGVKIAFLVRYHQKVNIQDLEDTLTSFIVPLPSCHKKINRFCLHRDIWNDLKTTGPIGVSQPIPFELSLLGIIKTGHNKTCHLLLLIYLS
jgi:hypothetical protein